MDFVSVLEPLNGVPCMHGYPESTHCCKSWLIEKKGVYEPWDSRTED